jgi:hypothetical protein
LNCGVFCYKLDHFMTLKTGAEVCIFIHFWRKFKNVLRLEQTEAHDIVVGCGTVLEA